ncbi:MAG: tetratricopeptide repeat protein [Roseiarcus sp.]
MERLINTLIAGGVLAFVLFGVAVAGPLEDGQAAYLRGDYAAVLAYWGPLAEQGDARAQGTLGWMYDTGQGVAQDFVQAAVWYRKAAEQGYATAQFSLGEMYADGRGVPQDAIMAHLWFNLAASRAMAADFATRDQALRNRDELAAKMTPAQIAEAQRMAREWKPMK